MNIIKWSEEKIRKLRFWDMGLIKLGCILFGLILGAYISEFIRQYIQFFLILFIIVYITAIYRFFQKK